MKKAFNIVVVCGVIAVALFWREAKIQSDLMEKGDWKAYYERRGGHM